MEVFEVKIHRMKSGFFNTKYFDPKTGNRKRKRFATLKEAKDYKRAVEKTVNSRGINAFNNLRIAQAMNDYIKKFPNSGVRARQNHFRGFIDKFGIHKVNEVTASDLQGWMEEVKSTNNLSSKTMNHVKTQFNGLFKYLKDEKYITQNPIEEVRFKRFDTPRRKRVILSIEEVRTMLENSKKFSPAVLYPYLATVAHTGARRGEVLKLKRSDIDFKTNLIHIRESKNSHERFVKISPMLEEVLKSQLKKYHFDFLITSEEGNQLLNFQLRSLMLKFKAFFPIENKNWGSHSLRHSFAYNFLKMSGKMYQLQAILGHRSIDVTVDLYGQLQAQDIECPSPYEYNKED